MTKHTMHCKLAVLCAAGLVGAACNTDDESTASIRQDVNGSSAPQRTEVVLFQNSNAQTGLQCSGAMISPRYMLTAGHCVHSQNETYDASTFIQTIDANGQATGMFNPVRAHTFGHLVDTSATDEQTGEGGTTDVAVVQFASPIPTAAMPIATHYPAQGAAATVFGFGCGAPGRRSATWAFGSAISSTCGGDSGGPAVIGDANGTVVWGLVSGFDSDGHTEFGSAEFYQEMILGQIQAWDQTDFDVGFDRGGFDFESFDLTGSDANPAACRSACQASDQCRAFTYVTPGSVGPNARCYLKNAVAGYSPCSYCTSGIKLSQEPGVDRWGSDYTSFTPSDTRPELCMAACGQDPVCKAYAYDPPDFFGAGSPPTCFLKTDGGSRMASPSVTAGLKRGLETDYDRTGGDYTWYQTSSSDPDTCRVSCAQDQRCRAFTFVAPGVTEPSGECHLKSVVPDAVASSGMTSGVKRGLDIGVDRYGGDLENFDLSTPTPEVCQAVCAQVDECQAFTFSPPGWNGSTDAPAHCWLKSSIPPASPNEPLISGIKGAEFF